jgi:hypothetical protein
VIDDLVTSIALLLLGAGVALCTIALVHAPPL